VADAIAEATAHIDGSTVNFIAGSQPPTSSTPAVSYVRFGGPEATMGTPSKWYVTADGSRIPAYAAV
jgi:hypothetical protein